MAAKRSPNKKSTTKKKPAAGKARAKAGGKAAPKAAAAKKAPAKGGAKGAAKLAGGRRAPARKSAADDRLQQLERLRVDGADLQAR